jgi:hypothetical protein
MAAFEQYQLQQRFENTFGDHIYRVINTAEIDLALRSNQISYLKL